MIQIENHPLRSQGHANNRPESPFVPLVGESAVRLASVGLQPVRIDGLPGAYDSDGPRLVRARRDLVGRIGEFRAFVVEEGGLGVLSIAFVPRPSLDLGVYSCEMVLSGSALVVGLGIYAGNGTWFAGQHAHHAWQDLRRRAPELVPDEAQRSARARQRGFSFEVSSTRDQLGEVEALHRHLWSAYLRSLHDALELDVEGAEKNARSVEAWKAHRRTVALSTRALAEADATDVLRLHNDVLTA